MNMARLQPELLGPQLIKEVASLMVSLYKALLAVLVARESPGARNIHRASETCFFTCIQESNFDNSTYVYTTADESRT